MRTVTEAGDGFLSVDTADLVEETLFPVSRGPRARLARWRARFRRRRGPLVRYWSAELIELGRDPVTVESWPAWARRQASRLIP